MKLFVTIFEETPERALDAIRAIDGDHDGVEIRAEGFGSCDFAAFRAATRKPVIFTRRGVPYDAGVLRQAIDAGIDLVDVEYAPGLRLEDREKIVLSHHDFDGMTDVERIHREMASLDCAHVKIAVTPQTFADNERLLRILNLGSGRLSVIGMGERGLYSRILAPFRGSQLQFVSRTDDRVAAPGQLSLRTALAIYGDKRDALRADRVFAVAGNPAGHSVSPAMHNPLFRGKGAAAAYTVASVERFEEITAPFLKGEPCGLSVTVPFKLDAYRFANEIGAMIGENARACEAVNTLVNGGRRPAAGGPFLADNTDVDGFETILRDVCGRDRKSVAIVGAGGTARAALVAVTRAGMHVTVFNRTEAKGSDLAGRFGARSEPLDALERFDGEVIINTTTATADVPLRTRAGMTYIAAAYGSPKIAERHARMRDNGVQVYDGFDLLRAQAVRQHELFMEVFKA